MRTFCFRKVFDEARRTRIYEPFDLFKDFMRWVREVEVKELAPLPQD
jgi:hypothetical protein